MDRDWKRRMERTRPADRDGLAWGPRPIVPKRVGEVTAEGASWAWAEHPHQNASPAPRFRNTHQSATAHEKEKNLTPCVAAHQQARKVDAPLVTEHTMRVWSGVTGRRWPIIVRS